MLRNISMSKRIYAIVILMFVSLIIMIFSLRWSIGRVAEISVHESQQIMLENQKEKLHIAVHSMAEALGRLVREETSLDRRKELIRNAISTIRFEEDKSGYYFVYDFSGVNVAHPLKPQFQDTNRLDIRDPAGKTYIRELRNNAKEGGFVEYTFEKPGKGNVKKLAYSESIPGTDYWIATGFYIDNFEERKTAIQNKIEEVSKSLSLTLTCVSLILLILVVLPLTQAIIRSIIKPLQSITNAVRTISQGNLDVSVDASGKDEVSLLGESFNDMTAKLAAARESLTAYQEQLEDMVHQRTEELSDSLRKLEFANEQIVESIQYARTIQKAILPPAGVISKYIHDYFVIWDPKDIIGGDLYWFKGDSDSFLVGVIDCTGHGVPGAIMTMIAGTTLGRVVNEIGPSNPAKILEEMNRIVRETLSQHMEETESDDGLDIGLCYVSKDRSMVYAGARISLFVLLGSETREIKGNRNSIGYKSSRPNTAFTNYEIKVEPGMTFYMATDGIKDQVGGDSRLPFGKSRFLDLLSSVQGLSFVEQKEVILSSFEQYCDGETRRDDITVFGFKL